MKLPHPYKHALPLAKGQELIAELKKAAAPFVRKLQCDGVRTKPVTRGVRLDIFLLGYRPGLCGEGSEVGMEKKEWDDLIESFRVLIKEALGVDIDADPWRKNQKFRLMFHTYIAYEEMLA